MTHAELEALIGRLGTRHGSQMESATKSTLKIHAEAFPFLIRVLDDQAYRTELWEQYGQAHEGEPVVRVPDEPTLIPIKTPALNAKRYDSQLQQNAILALSRKHAAQTADMAAIFREAGLRLRGLPRA